MLALEIDDFLPDPLDSLPQNVIESIKSSRCCHCDKVYGGGKIIMFVVSGNEVRWWHTTTEAHKPRNKREFIHRQPCDV